MVEQEVLTVNILDTNRQQAILRLDTYLQTPKESVLREYQLDTVQSLRDYLAEGETAGYITLPPGSGKTHVIAEISQDLGLNTVLLSNTKTVLEQTFRVIKSLAPDTDITNYYSPEKNTTGQLVNTTYQSFPSLLEKGLISPQDVELLICDESDLGLGEQRHKIYRQLSNALLIGLTATPFFTPLEGYIRRGIVKEDERWVKLFTNCIHEMSLEEGMERGILTGLDVHLLETNAQVGNIEISKGDYDKGQLEKFLNTQARNWLTVAMIGGMDKVPKNIRFTEKQLEELGQIHQKIKGKRTAIFCLSVAHAEALTEVLRGTGITAGTIHGKTPDEMRQKHLANHKEGTTQVLLGVDVLTRGWDSPETEAGIYLAPTCSGIVGVQQLGRILRPSQDTGKERAIAIQLVDKFSQRKQAPVLIPNIFDPLYVLHGTQTGKEIHRGTQPARQPAPTITFSGMDIEVLIQESQSRDLLQRRLKGASLEEISQTLESVLLEIQQEQPDAKPLQIYQALAERLPFHIPFTKQHGALQDAASLDSNISKIGRNLLIFLHIRSILGVVEPYFSDNQEDNNDIIQAAIGGVVSGLSRLSPNIPITQQIYRLAERGAAQFISKEKNVPIGWVLERKEEEMVNLLQETLSSHPDMVLYKEGLDELSGKLAEQLRTSKLVIRQYLQYLWSRKFEESLQRQGNVEDSTYAEIAKELLKEAVEEVLYSLTDRQSKVLRLRFAIDRELDHPLTLEEVGQEFGVNRERIRQIEAMAVRHLRHPSRSGRLRDYLDIDDETQLPVKYTGYRSFGQIISGARFWEQYYNTEDQIGQFASLSGLDLDQPTLQTLASCGIFEIRDFFSKKPADIFKAGESGLPQVINAVQKLLEDERVRKISRGLEKDEPLLRYISDAIMSREDKWLEILALWEQGEKDVFVKAGQGDYSNDTRKRLFDLACYQLKYYLERFTD